MKKVLILTLTLILSLTFVACKDTKTSSSDIQSTVTSDIISSKIVSSEEETDSPPEAPSPAPWPAESQPTPPPSSQVTSSYVLKNYDVTVGEYTVTDAENAKGLSNTKSGFGFGVAKNGIAHNISFNNQTRFVNMQGVTALALDTKSQDKRMYLTFDCGYEYKNLDDYYIQ